MLRFLFFPAAFLAAILLSPILLAHAAYSGNSTGYAWSEKGGWISFNTTSAYGVQVTDTALDGYAWGEKTGYISLTRDSGTPTYGVTNTISLTTGQLSGYAWSEKAGYIRFAATSSTYANTSALNYGVTINGTTGAYSGYAWSEKLGWIKFSGVCSSGTTGICSGGVYGVTTTWRTTTSASNGSLESATIDFGTASSTPNYLIWQGTQPTGTTVKFQLASASSSSGPWSYIGPDGTTGSYYTPSGPNAAEKIRQANHLNYRYLRYKMYLYSDTGQTVTPNVTDVTISYSR